jgi:peptidoglycan/xylan/chitin deacetylase (PgdA/CDA1 family)
MSATPEVATPSVTRFAIRTIKLGISSLSFIWIQLRRWLSPDRPATCVVLYYHSVPAQYRKRFEEQMQMVANRAAAIDITHLCDLPPHTHSVVITFDDALESFAENAVPVLVGLKIPATVFAVADALGSKPGWGEGYFSPEERVMSPEQLGRLPDSIRVGSHTLTHPYLTALSQEAAGEEITRSREKLEALLHRPITLFSFPHGAFNSSTVCQCQEAGYERVFTIEPVLASAGKNQFVVGRVPADPWDWRVEFYLKIFGAYCWQPYAQVVKRKIRALFWSQKDGSPRDSEGARPLM